MFSHTQGRILKAAYEADQRGDDVNAAVFALGDSPGFRREVADLHPAYLSVDCQTDGAGQIQNIYVEGIADLGRHYVERRQP